MRLIDADELKKDLTRFYDNEVTAKQLIDEQPTIEPERKKGKWIHDNPNTFKCSRCNKYLDISCGNMKMNFCPNCGAYMRGDKDEDR